MFQLIIRYSYKSLFSTFPQYSCFYHCEDYWK